MAVEFSYRLRTDETGAMLRELDDVILLAPARGLDGEAIPAGAEGTVVGIWRDGDAFEVEFSDPEGALATVPATAVRRVGRHAR